MSDEDCKLVIYGEDRKLVISGEDRKTADQTFTEKHVSRDDPVHN